MFDDSMVDEVDDTSLSDLCDTMLEADSEETTIPELDAESQPVDGI